MESNFPVGLSDATSVILAAGENTRLKGLVAPYQKPLLLINGVPLIKHAIQHAEIDWGVSRHVIVCSPHNAREITAICGEKHRYVIQPSPTGVLDAMRIGLDLVHTLKALVMCSDNIFKLIPGLSPIYGKNYIGTSIVVSPRLTRLGVLQGMIVPEESAHDGVVSWLGPIYHEKDRLVQAISSSDGNLIRFLTSLSDLRSLPMNCLDLGVPEAL